VDQPDRFGYPGAGSGIRLPRPTNVAFLRLERPHIAPSNLTVLGLEAVPSGLTEASEDQHRSLNQALQVRT
jgi:hypothetical protein